MMSFYKIAKPIFLSTCKRLFDPDGFSILFLSKLIKKTNSGNYQVEFNPKDYVGLWTSMDFGVRIDEIEALTRSIDLAVPQELRLKSFLKEIDYRASIAVSWNALVSNLEWTYEKADELSKLEAIAGLWYQRFKDLFSNFLLEFGSIRSIAQMHRENSPRLRLLFHGSETGIRRSGVLFIFYEFGRNEADKYVQQYRKYIDSDWLNCVEVALGPLHT